MISLRSKHTERPIRLPSEVNFVPQHWTDRYLEKLWRCRATRRAGSGEQIVLPLRPRD